MNYTDKDFLYCYDKELSNYFKKHNLRYIVKAKSIKDDKIFTMWQKTDELYNLMRKYSSHKLEITNG